jgi:hypothetical protein
MMYLHVACAAIPRRGAQDGDAQASRHGRRLSRYSTFPDLREAERQVFDDDRSVTTSGGEPATPAGRGDEFRRARES